MVNRYEPIIIRESSEKKKKPRSGYTVVKVYGKRENYYRRVKNDRLDKNGNIKEKKRSRWKKPTFKFSSLWK